LLDKITAMALDSASLNHPDLRPDAIYIQITALREAVPAIA
jgi:hypothetical protein